MMSRLLCVTECVKGRTESVDVFGSHIHRLGLFCLQEIELGDMVIEYAGTVIMQVYWPSLTTGRGFTRVKGSAVTCFVSTVTKLWM